MKKDYCVRKAFDDLRKRTPQNPNPNQNLKDRLSSIEQQMRKSDEYEKTLKLLKLMRKEKEGGDKGEGI